MRVCVYRPLFGRRSAQNIFTVGIEPHVPKPNTVHQLFRILEFSIAAEDGFDKFTACIAAHRDGALAAFALGCLPHVELTGFEQLLEPIPQAVATFQKVLDNLLCLDALNPWETFVGPLDLSRKLDQQQPQVARHVGHGSGCAMVEHRPVVDPLAERVGIEYAAQEDDGGLGWVPVLDRVPWRDSGALGVRFGGGRWRLRRWRWFGLGRRTSRRGLATSTGTTG